MDFIKEAERNPDLLNTTKTLPADYGAMSVMAEMLTKSFLMGLDRSTRKMEFAEPTAEEIETLPYAEAVEYLRKRDVLNKVDYDKLSAQLKFRAFTASRISDGALLKRINDELVKNIEAGNGLKDFLGMTKTDVLSKVGLGNAGGWYWETVYRTNVQTAYNAGRIMGYEEDKPLALELVVIDDARTTDYCRQYAGKGFILPYDDPFWKTHIPPFHFNCRTTIRAIYDERELPESWSSKADIEAPAKGFGNNPVVDDSWWKELSSQVRQAKMYGVQGEIERAAEILSLGRMLGKGLPKSDIDIKKEPIEIKKKKVRNKINGVKKGKPMSFEDADHGSVNPNYKADSLTAQSCQSCVPVFKARLDGFNIQTKPFDLNNKVMDALSLPGNTKLAYIDNKTGTFPDYIIPPDRRVPEIYKWLNNQIDKESYYSFEFYKKGGGDGHVMCICWKDDTLLLYDPQRNEKYFAESILDELWTMRTKTIKLINISNCKLNKYVLDYISEASA